jgi:predicted glutamine amidotransferase
MKNRVVCVLVFLGLTLSGLWCDECSLLGLVGTGQDVALTPAVSQLTLTKLQSVGNNANPDGWGVAYYPLNSQVTGSGTIYANSGSYTSNRYADDDMAYNNGDFTTLITKFSSITAGNYGFKTHAIIGHVRKSTTGASGVVDPHPFIYIMSGHAYTAAFHGTVEASVVANMRTVVTN